MGRYAVIDLGTNTFHLLIIMQQDEDGLLIEQHRERVFVRLAENGIAKIGVAPFQRGISAIQQFNKTILANPPQAIKAFGTAALRTASNAAHFISEIKSKTGIQIDIIPGKEEARLIYLGVKQVVNFGSGYDLIMDIGGGSVEFIIANNTGVQWAESFPIGVAVLYNQFHNNDPISPSEIKTLISYLNQVLIPLSNALKKYPVSRLIGASGTFDVLEENLATESHSQQQIVAFPIDRYFPFHTQIVRMSLDERMQMDKLPKSRADMIVVALLLINTIIQNAGIKEILVSSFAMKEGMLKELMFVK